MSSAHRPTWDPAKGKADQTHLSHQVPRLAIPSHTKLKFRQPNQITSLARKDLKQDLEKAEAEARNHKRRALGLDNETEDQTVSNENKVEQNQLVSILSLDKDDDEDEEEQEVQEGNRPSSSSSSSHSSSDGDDDDQDSDNDDDDDDEEDDTLALLKELEKIKAERAAEKSRQQAEQAATGNPLLNLEQAVSSYPTATSFGVKKRWDDDVIFKNQSAGERDASQKSGFINDLTRTEFHKKFMSRYIN